MCRVERGESGDVCVLGTVALGTEPGNGGIVGEAWKSGAGTPRLTVFMGAATCAALPLGDGAWLAGLLWRC
ncbi:hypothetical protein [Streptomyces sp. CB00455]|uniref:hypothetical protein n=1 Tax=Streptomyces sp. CB00455 TaxID=1703927 RepID=UPI000AD90FC0|nr:hypothetical protein [Streptomyces sp. CB00455]